jgi:tetratricopeptide (TPR) repeat protein
MLYDTKNSSGSLAKRQAVDAYPLQTNMYTLFSYRKILRSFLFFTLLFLLKGCVQSQSSLALSHHNEALGHSDKQTAAAPPADATEHDYGCSYFYFLWGRHSELAGRYEAALEAYEKALICDPEADFVISKLPLILLRLNRNEEAIARLLEYLEKRPADIPSRMLLAGIFIRRGNLQEAVEQYRTIHSLNPQDTSALLLLSELYLAENKTDQAKDSLRQALQREQQSYPAHLLLARVLVAEKNFAKGLEHYQQALALSPSEGLHMEMAEVFIQQHKYSDAIAIYQELLQQDAGNDEARVALIYAYLLEKQEDKAMDELKRLREAAENPEGLDLTVVKLYIRWEEYDKAIALLEEVLQQKDIPEARYLLAALRFQEGQYEQVLHDLKKIHPESGEDYEDALILQVRTLLELGEYEQAIQVLEQTLQENKQLSPDLSLLLAGIYQTLEQEEEGLKVFRRALEVHPQDEELLYEYGLFLAYTEHQQQALKVMQDILRINPDHAGALNYIGYTWADKNINLNKAFLYLNRAKELLPENASIQDSLGWLYYRLGKLDEAKKWIRQAAELAPKDPAILDHLAEVYLAAGQAEEAIKIWNKILTLYTQNDSNKSKKRLEREQKASEQIKKKIQRIEAKESP